jgi:23S rRNA (adenine2030-N6)-methyltransferase
MTGSGMILINPPWTLSKQVEVLLPWINQVLTEGQGYWKQEWLVPEQAKD